LLLLLVIVSPPPLIPYTAAVLHSGLLDVSSTCTCSSRRRFDAISTYILMSWGVHITEKFPYVVVV
jgi:hypothetical protein